MSTTRVLDPTTQSALALKFKGLHIPGSPVFLTNVWDAPSASIVLRNPKTKALATASYAIAEANGVRDDDLTLEMHLAALSKIVQQIASDNKAHEIPFTVDLQNGYGDRLEEAVTSVVQLGAVGINIEDTRSFAGELVDVEEQVARIKKVIEVAGREGVKNFVVNARTDAIVCGKSIDEAIARGKRYLEAGATTVFVWGGPLRPGMRDEEIEVLVRALGGMINVSLKEGGLSVKELAELGVARISMGPGLWKTAMLAVERRVADLLG